MNLNSECAEPQTAVKTTRPIESKIERVYQTASLLTALVLGASFAAMEAIHREPSGISFQFSRATLTAFAVGVVFGVLYWKLVSVCSLALRGLSKLFGLSTRLFILVSVATFLYPFRFLPTDQFPEAFAGIAAASVALSTGGFMIWKIGGFLDADAKQGELLAGRRT